MSTNKHNVQQYRSFWLHNRNGVHYVGLLLFSRFLGKELQVQLERMAEISRIEGTSDWRPGNTFRRGYEFVFPNCKVKKIDPFNIEVLTNDGDSISMSSETSKVDEVIAILDSTA